MQVEDKYKIPPIIHFIWAGGEKNLDDKGLANIAKWAMLNPGVMPILWVDEKTSGTSFSQLQSEYLERFISIFKKEYKEMFKEEPDSSDLPSFIIKDIRKEGLCKSEGDIVDYAIDRMDPNYGLSSDVLRYRILAREGGIYVDVTDVLSVKEVNGLRKLPSVVFEMNVLKEENPKHVVFLDHLSQKLNPSSIELGNFSFKSLTSMDPSQAEIYLNSLHIGNDTFICTPYNPYIQFLSQHAEQNLLVKNNFSAMVNMAYSAHNVKDMTIEATGPLCVKNLLFNPQTGEFGQSKSSPFTYVKTIKGQAIAIKPVRCSSYQITQPIQNTRLWNNVGLSLDKINNVETACNKLIALIKMESELMGILRLEDHLRTISAVAKKLNSSPEEAKTLLLKLIVEQINFKEIQVVQLVSSNALIVEFCQKHDLMKKTFLTQPVNLDDFNNQAGMFLKIFESVTNMGAFNVNVFSDKLLPTITTNNLNSLFKPLELMDIIDKIDRGVEFMAMLKKNSKMFPMAHNLMTGNAAEQIEQQYFKATIQKYAKIMEIFAEVFIQNGMPVKELMALNEKIVALGGNNKLSELNSKYKANGDLGLALRRAANEGNLEAVKYLSKLIDVNEPGAASGKTALHVAAEGGHTAVVKFLLEEAKANANIEDKNKNRALDLAKDTITQNLLKEYTQPKKTY